MRKYKLTIYLVDRVLEHVIHQEFSQQPTTVFLAYLQAKEILKSVGIIEKYTLERVL